MNFQVSSYQPLGAKRSYPMYLMTRDGFTFLAMSDAGATGFTGARAAEFKEKYIAEFNRMEAHNDTFEGIHSLDCSKEFRRLIFEPYSNTTAIIRHEEVKAGSSCRRN